jgi:hypothetical protein
LQEIEEIVDVLAPASAEADVIQAEASRTLSPACVVLIGARDVVAGPATDVVDELVGAMDHVESEIGHELVIERDAFFEAIHVHSDVGDAVDLHRAS